VNTYQEIKENVIRTGNILNWDNESSKLLEVYKSLSNRPNHPS